MARKAFDEKLRAIREDLVKLGKITKESVGLSLKALTSDDSSLCKKVSELEEQSDLLNLAIEELGIKLTATQQPVAGDLRFISGAMRISVNFERICDLAEKIANVSNRAIKMPVLSELITMSEVVQEMIEIDIIAISSNSSVIPKELKSRDDTIDALKKEAYAKLKKTAVENPSLVDDVVDFLFVARNLERIGDIAAKTGSRIIYMNEGKRVWIK